VIKRLKRLTLSATSIAAWRKNPRAFYYSYVLGITPRPVARTVRYGPPLDFGQAFHRFEELYTPEKGDIALLLEQVLSEYPQLPEKGLRSKEHLIELITQYAAAFPPTQNALSELELSAPLTEVVTYVGHIDKLILSEPPIIMDFKTSSKHLYFDLSLTSNPNNAALGYLWLAWQAGHAAETFTFRGISTDQKLLDPTYIPKNRAGDEKQRPPLFLEFSYTPTSEAVNEWHAALVKDAQRIQEDIETGRFNCACTLGDKCDYRKICCNLPQERAIVIKNEYETKPSFRGFSVEFENE